MGTAGNSQMIVEVTTKGVVGETVMVEAVAVVGETEEVLIQVLIGAVSLVVGEVTETIATVVMLGETVEENLVVPMPGAIVMLVEVIVLETLGETEIAVKDLHGVATESQVVAEEMLPDHTKPPGYREIEKYKLAVFENK